MRQNRKKRRWLRTTAVVAVLAACGLGGAAALDAARPQEETVVAAEVVKVATAERTDLSADATLDGTVENSSTLSVRHRIEGATPSTSGGSGSSTPSDSSTGAAPAQGVAFVQLQPVSDVEVDASSTTSVPPDTSTPDTSAPDTTVPDATVPEPSVPESSVPQSTVPDATVPPGTTAPETTTTPAPSPDTAPAAGRGAGGAPSGGAAVGAGGGGTTTGSAGGGTTTGSAGGTERVTSLPALGATIDLGDVVYTVDGRPVVAMAGGLPAWRTLSTSSDDGPDIAQLELSLVALGYDADGALVVDNEYDSATADAVEAWQAGLALDATGEVELGDVVFLPTTVTVTALDTSVGADVTEADQILDVSGTTQQVVAAVTDDVTSIIVPGLEVQLQAQAGPVTGVVTLLRSVAADDGTITTEAVIAPSADLAGQADGSTLDVTVAIDGPTDAITVPADALVSKLDGTYAVEVRDESGDHWVAVQVLDVRGSTVAVDGIAEGTHVLVPA